MEITLEVAQRLFKEANEWVKNSVMLAEESEIRALAIKTFKAANISTIGPICSEIFRVLACEFMDEAS
jgi:hypothetical protein